MSKRRNERLITHYSEKREIDGEIYIVESWEKKQKFSPTIKKRKYKKGDSVSKIPSRDDPYII